MAVSQWLDEELQTNWLSEPRLILSYGRIFVTKVNELPLMNQDQDGKVNLAEEVSGCANDEKLRQLAHGIRAGLSIPMKAQCGQTPIEITPSPGSGVDVDARDGGEKGKGAKQQTKTDDDYYPLQDATFHDPSKDPHTTVQMTNKELRERDTHYALHWRPNRGSKYLPVRNDEYTQHAKAKKHIPRDQLHGRRAKEYTIGEDEAMPRRERASYQIRRRPRYAGSFKVLERFG